MPGRREPETGHSISQVPSGLEFAEGNDDFALRTFGQLRERPGNMLFSPFSLRAALAMTQAGARGETAAQMGEVLGTSSSDDTSHAALGAILQHLNAPGGRREMAVANSLWGQAGARVEAQFLERIARHYGGGLDLVDFRGDADGARATINRWVEDKTKQKILGLIPRGGLDGSTRLVLVNAIYFKGRWVLQFDQASTREQPFDLEGGGIVDAPLMHQQNVVRYLQGGGYQAVDLVYEGGDLSMLVLLPERKDELHDLEKRLSVRMIDDCVRRAALRDVALFLPRFKITWGAVDLSRPFEALGMSLPFDRSRADFSGINGCRPPHEDALVIGAVYHKAFAEVNEEGTEAAAATATRLYATIAPRPGPPPVPVFRADHPFLFAIRDRESGALLFLGRVADPTRES